jgi:hypothetical protein
VDIKFSRFHPKTFPIDLLIYNLINLQKAPEKDFHEKKLIKKIPTMEKSLVFVSKNYSQYKII